MIKLLKFTPYLIAAAFVVLLGVAVLSKIMPTAEDLKPGAEAMLRSMGKIK